MGFLTVKHGGLPTWAWLAIGAAGIGVGLWLRRRMTSSSAAGSVVSSAAPSGTSYPDLTAAGAGGGVAAPSSTTGGYAPSDLIGAYEQGGTDAAANFANALNLVQSLQGALGGGVGVSGVTASSGGYQTPSAPPPGPSPVKSSTTTAIAKAAKAPTRYYTYKKNVPLAAGQTLHFTKGKGYYAA